MFHGRVTHALPLDPDPGSLSPRPAHLRPGAIGLVFGGGALGALVRELLSLAFPARADVPWAILAINVLGAFLLALLLASLTARGPDEGARRALRLLLGTGLMGGFTTYSTLAVASATLLGQDRVAVGAGYALATLVLGAAATLAGLVVAGVLAPRRAA